MQKITDIIPLSRALTGALKGGYNFQTLRHDVVAGLVVSLVALPLAMALAIAVGLPPQHGLYTAIVAGVAVPLLGGSLFQVSGPTAAFVVIVAPIVSTHGLRGLIIATIMAGLFLMVLGLARLGRYINFVPYPVTTGFTAGIAVVIGTLALNDFLGLHIAKLDGAYIHKLVLIAHQLPTLYWPEAVVGIVSLIVMFTSARLLPKLPSPVIGIAVGTLAAYLLHHQGFDVATLGSRFHYLMANGETGHGIPPFAPSFHIPGLSSSPLFAWPTYIELKMLFVPALVIAVLGALESLLSATVADHMSGSRHHPSAELLGVGIGNILSGLAGGIPATGAIARTATNIHAGARSPLAASFHAFLILIYVLCLAPYMSYIPMAALSALLILVAYRMSHWRQFVNTLKIAPMSDSMVLMACFGFTVFIDMVAGVSIGVLLACFLLLKRVANLTEAAFSHVSEKQQSKIAHLKLPPDTFVYHINGSLFFGNVATVLDGIETIGETVNTLIVDMENVPLIDMSGIVAMATMILNEQAKNTHVVLCGKSDIIDKILRQLSSSARARVKTVQNVEEAVAALK